MKKRIWKKKPFISAKKFVTFPSVSVQNGYPTTSCETQTFYWKLQGVEVCLVVINHGGNVVTLNWWIFSNICHLKLAAKQHFLHTVEKSKTQNIVPVSSFSRNKLDIKNLTYILLSANEEFCGVYPKLCQETSLPDHYAPETFKMWS